MKRLILIILILFFISSGDRLVEAQSISEQEPGVTVSSDKQPKEKASEGPPRKKLYLIIDSGLQI